MWTLKEKGNAVKLHGTFSLRGQKLKITMVNQFIPGLEDASEVTWADFILVNKAEGGPATPTQRRKATELVKAEMIKRFKWS